MTDTELRAALGEEQATGLTGWAEARGEPLIGQVGVVCAIRNRVQTGTWGATYRAVCFAKAQFSCWSPAGGPREAANYAAVMAQAERLLDGLPPEPMLRQCLWIARGVIAGDVEDVTEGACHYMTRDRYLHDPPPWAKTMRPLVTLGRHVFLGG